MSSPYSLTSDSDQSNIKDGNVHKTESLITFCSSVKSLLTDSSFYIWIESGASSRVGFTQRGFSMNAVASPENLQVWVRLQNPVVTPVNNRTVCKRNCIKNWQLYSVAVWT